MKRREVTKYVSLFLYSLRLQGVYSFTKCTKELFKVYGAWYLSCIGLMLYLVISCITCIMQCALSYVDYIINSLAMLSMLV
jgi:hypothetical protein